MPSLKAIRTRITSVKNTRKITRAMKLVSTAKLRRAQDALVQARPYTQAITKVVGELSAVAADAPDSALLPHLHQRLHASLVARSPRLDSLAQPRFLLRELSYMKESLPRRADSSRERLRTDT